MRVIIPKNLTNINVILQMYLLMGKYSKDIHEDSSGSDEYLKKDRNYDYVRDFIERTDRSRGKYDNDYIEKLFYSIKGCKRVFQEMENHLGIVFKEDPHYDINHLDLYIESITTNDSSEYFRSLNNFLRSLLYFIPDGTDPDGNDSDLEDPINKHEYVFTDIEGNTLIRDQEHSKSGDKFEETIEIISTKDEEDIGYKVTVDSGSDWLKATVDEDGNIVYEAEKNDTSVPRVGIITATQDESGKTIVIVVTQGAKDPEYIFTTDEGETDVKLDFSDSSEEQSGTIGINSTKDGKDIGYTISTSDPWIKAEIDENGDLKYTIKENENEEYRTGTITLVQDESGKVITIVVTQKGNGDGGSSIPPEPDPDDKYVFTDINGDTRAEDNEAAESQVSFSNSWKMISTKNNSSIGFTVTCNQPWLTVSNSTDTIYYSANENTSDSPRTAVITSVQNESGLVFVLSVTQGCPNNKYIFTDIDGNIEAEDNRNQDNYKEFTENWGMISSKNGNEIGFTSTSTSSWLTVSNTDSTITYTADENTSSEPRTGIIVAIQEESGLSFVLRVTQGGIDTDPEEPDLPTDPSYSTDIFNLIVDDSILGISDVDMVLYKEYTYNFDDRDDDI